MITKTAMLGEDLRCCGRKPLVYKKPVFRYFCPRCDRQYGSDKVQRGNWGWLPTGVGFTPRYPDQEYVSMPGPTGYVP